MRKRKRGRKLEKKLRTIFEGTSLVAQWLRIRLPILTKKEMVLKNHRGRIGIKMQM